MVKRMIMTIVIKIRIATTTIMIKTITMMIMILIVLIKRNSKTISIMTTVTDNLYSNNKQTYYVNIANIKQTDYLSLSFTRSITSEKQKNKKRINLGSCLATLSQRQATKMTRHNDHYFS